MNHRIAGPLRVIGSFTAVILLVSLTASAQVPPIRVACVGNSITIGYGLPDPNSAYPQQLGRLLGSKYQVKNFGVSGRTMLRKGDYPYWKEEFYREALVFKPQIVTICLGTNDSKAWNWRYKSGFFDDYMDMIQSFREANPHVQVFVCLPPPVFNSKFGITDSVVRREVVPIVNAVRIASGSCLIDFYNSMTGDGADFFDGVHPDSVGDSIMAQTAYEAIEASPPGIIREFGAGVRDAAGHVTLYWETTTGSTVTLNGKEVNASGSVVITPAVNSTFTLITSGAVADTSTVRFP
jgi:acyl-CoA thioesterase I